MVAPNEFWLTVHQLAEAYDAEGLTEDERVTNIVAQFQGLPTIVQRKPLADLARTATHCPDLHALVTAAANEAEALPAQNVG